ncbi:unnamed protein product [Caenorhabditis sp. 36 PRJEB53466]|nr:unnamed protein product [Caenorhabditis sp. 36 PRJEB53466]
MLLRLLLLLSTVHLAACQGKCVMTECEGETDSNFPPCRTNHSTSFPLTLTRSKHPDALDRLEKYCSHLLHDDEKASVCCTPLQLKGMTERISNAVAILGSCPSCFDNFAKLWCQYTCSPRQADFMKVQKFAVEAKKEIIEQIDYQVNRKFAEGLFDSCRYMWFANGPALRLMSIGGTVSFENFYEFMGQKNDALNIPVSTSFQFNRKKNAMNVPTTPCHKSAGPNVPACGFIDCPTNSVQLLDLSGVDKLSKTVVTSTFPESLWVPKIFGMFALVFLVVVLLKYSCHTRLTDGEGCYVDISEGNIEILFDDSCKWYANTVIQHPWMCAMLGLFVAAICCSGNAKFHSLTHSIDQVSAADGVTRRNEKTFIETFGPVHRKELIFVNIPAEMEDMFDMDLFKELFTLVGKVQNMTVIHGNSSVTLNDICFKPLGSAYGCAILSPTGYFQNSPDTFLNAGAPTEADDLFMGDQYWNHLKYCIHDPLRMSTYSKMTCFGEFGGPIDPVLVFGGYNETSKKGAERFLTARTLMITILVKGPEELASAWEAKFIRMMKEHRMEHAEFTFMAESSVTDELQKEVETDKLVSVLSCGLVLLWVLAQLGIYHWPESSFLSALVHHKLIIAISAVLINVISVWCSIGVFSFFDIHATDNAIVVLFFVVTCIGINRIFVTIRTFQNHGHCYGRPEMSKRDMEHRITDTMRRSIPIVLTSSLICSTCFFLAGGVLPYISVKMPSVEVFARHAGLAILFDTFFYLLVILPLYQYDAKREMSGRCEIWPCYRLSDASQTNIVLDSVNGSLRSPVDWFKLAIAPLINYKFCRLWIVSTHAFTLCVSVYCTLHLEYGFDQTMAFSKTSYLSRHFENLNRNLNIGPPVWFVVEGNVKWYEQEVQNKFCTLAGCHEDSMGNTIRSLAYTNNYDGNFLHGDVYIWLDSFLQFMHPRGTCCKTDGKDYCKLRRF